MIHWTVRWYEGVGWVARTAGSNRIVAHGRLRERARALELEAMGVCP
jgi:hypothetical protein